MPLDDGLEVDGSSIARIKKVVHDDKVAPCRLERDGALDDVGHLGDTISTPEYKGEVRRKPKVYL